jgi:outer membrane protein OmpA-like peptidoglycan-associated protein
MTHRSIAWALGAWLALTFSVWAQGAGEEQTNCTVQSEDVKSWTMEVEGKEYSVRTAAPAYEGDTGLFHMSSAYTLPKGKVSFSLFRDNIDRDPKDLDISVHGVSLGFGVTSRLELFGSMGIQNRVNADAYTQAGFFNDFPLAGTVSSYPSWQTGVGDLKVGAKFKLLDDYDTDPVGLAIRGLVKVPTADDEKGLGTGKVSLAADLILSKSLGQSADLHASIGYIKNSDPDNINIADALKWGVGLNIPACHIFQIQAEVTGKSYGDADFDQTNPIDLVVGPALWIKPGIYIRPAISWNLAFDDRGLNSSGKSYTGRHISIGYHPGTPCCEIEVARPLEAPPNRPPTVACESDRSQILPGETVRCRATASDPDGDPVTLSWRASAGRIVGDGPEVTFDSSGVKSPATVTVTVTASDGKGGTGESVCTIRVEAPEVKPVTTCSSAGFPRNSARLNNVDKACLDDVISRAKQDPQGRIVIKGHADRGERYPEVVARKRGEAAKSYLVQGGVDESRINVRSAGATQPADTGRTRAARASNRRVEVIFVPEGATLPEESE